MSTARGPSETSEGTGKSGGTQNRRDFFKNVSANLGRGGVAALVSLLLPPILVRHMSLSEYGVWILVLQCSAYVSYLDFGLQTAVGRYVAFANETRDTKQRDSIFSTATVALALAGLLGLLLLVIAAVFAPQLFPTLPRGFIIPMRAGMLIVGGSIAVSLPASACAGVFVGMQRYDVSAWIVGGTKILGAVGIIVAALSGGGVVVMSAVLAACNLAASMLQYLILRRLAPEIHFHRNLLERSTARELWFYCLGLTVMSMSMLLVSGLDVVLVGRFEFKAITPYSVAAVLVAFLAGLLSAAINVLLPHGTKLHARGDSRGLGRLVLKCTRFSVLLLLYTGTPLIVYGRPIMRIWIGSQFEVDGSLILSTLVAANIIRLVPLGYAVMLVAVGQHRLVKLSPMIEAISNVSFSILLGIRWGAAGVAFGTLIGAIFGVLAHLFYSMPRSKKLIEMSILSFARDGVILPSLCCVPLILLASFSAAGVHMGFVQGFIAFAASAFPTLALLKRDGELNFLTSRLHFRRTPQ